MELCSVVVLTLIKPLLEKLDLAMSLSLSLVQSCTLSLTLSGMARRFKVFSL